MALTNPAMAAYAFSGLAQTSVYVPDGSLLLFQQPNRIAPPGASTMALLTAQSLLSGVDFKGAVPAEVGVYATLAVGDPRAVLFDWANASGTGRTFYWGHTGSPADLSIEGWGCLINAVDLLLSEKTVVVTPVPAR